MFFFFFFFTYCLLPVEIGAASDCVVPKVFLGLLIAKVFQGVSPQQVTHGPKCWGLLEPVQLGHTHTHTRENRPTKSFVILIQKKTEGDQTNHKQCF